MGKYMIIGIAISIVAYQMYFYEFFSSSSSGFDVKEALGATLFGAIGGGLGGLLDFKTKNKK
ncbi:hypothetical protein [Kangiella sp. M94]